MQTRVLRVQESIAVLYRFPPGDTVRANRPSASRVANRRSILPRFYRGKFILSPSLPVRSCHPVGKTSKVARRDKYLSLRNGCASRGIKTTSSSCPAISVRGSSPRKRLSALCTLQPLPLPPLLVVRGSRRPIAGRAIPPLAEGGREKREKKDTRTDIHAEGWRRRKRGGGRPSPPPGIEPWLPARRSKSDSGAPSLFVRMRNRIYLDSPPD